MSIPTFPHRPVQASLAPPSRSLLFKIKQAQAAAGTGQSHKIQLEAVSTQQEPINYRQEPRGAQLTRLKHSTSMVYLL